MEDKVPVVIQGRTIERERPTRRMERARYASPGSVVTRSESESYALRTLREARSPLDREGPRIRHRSDSSRIPENRVLDRRLSTGHNAFQVRPRLHRRGEESFSQNNPLMIKIAVSVLLALVILLLNSIKLPFTQAVVNQVRTVLTRDFDFDEALGKLKFVGDALPDEIKAVFGHDTGPKKPDPTEEEDNYSSLPAFAAPVSGEVVHSFGEQITLPGTGKVYSNQGIDVKTDENASVFASADGVVAAVEQHETYGLSIWLDHGNKVFSFYGRCGQADVKAGQRIRGGQKLGTVDTPSQGQPMLHFQIWMDGKPANPLEIIDRAGQDSEGRGV